MTKPPANDNASATEAQRLRPCPICGRPATAAMHPFCSKRCADVDLHRWLGGTYAIPTAPSGDDDEDGADGGRDT